MITLLKRNIIRSTENFDIHSPYGIFAIEESQELTIKGVISFELDLRDENGEIIPFGVITEELPDCVILSPNILSKFDDVTEIDFDRIQQWFDHQKQHINNRIKKI